MQVSLKGKNDFEKVMVRDWVIWKDTLNGNRREERHPACQELGGHRKECERRKTIRWNIVCNSFYSKEMQRILWMSQPGNNW